MSELKMINIGCGTTLHPEWINLDVAPALPDVVKVNIIEGLPFSSEFADVCYSSHVLEHLDKRTAHSLIVECFRVLKPGGTVRLVVPDLGAIASEYLRMLKELTSGDESRELDYDWIMLELYDQAVRNVSGGEMAKFLIDLEEEDRAFVRSRIGLEAEKVWTNGVGEPLQKRTNNLVKVAFWVKKLADLRERFASWLFYLVAGAGALNSYELGLFRNSGEVHQWMYDCYSLKRLLEQAGFVSVRVCAANESSILDFKNYSLEVVNEVVRKPDSLYVEAIKP